MDMEQEMMQEEDNLLTLTDENGEETEFEYLDSVEYEGAEYLILTPTGEESGQVVILQVEPVDEEYNGVEATEEMLILCGFGRPDLDRLLSAIRKGKLKNVALKAALTPTNALWSGVKLQGELAQEHAYMHGRKVPKPRHDSL